MRQLSEGLYVAPIRSPTLPPATHTNAWVLGEDRVTVIDPAGVMPEHQANLSRALAGRTVETIFLTHHHGDHIGGVQALREETGARVLAHPETAARVPFPIDARVDEGFVLRTDAGDWKALHTPGHAYGHLCLFRDDGFTVAGDMVAGEGTILIEPSEGDLGTYLASLTRMITYGPRTLLPAHGPEIANAVEYLRYYIDHRNKRSDQIREALTGAGWKKPIDLVPTIYAAVPEPFWPMAARQVLSHLLWLVDEGEAETDADRFRMLS